MQLPGSRRLASLATLALIAFVAALEPPQKSGGDKNTKSASKAAEFPTLDPFIETWGWRHYFDTPFEDLDVAKTLDDLDREWKSRDERSRVPRRDTKQDAAQSALLEPQIERSRRFQIALVPRVIASLQPLHKAYQWTAKQFQAAQRIGKGAALIEGAPTLSFSDTDSAANHAAIERFIAWFRENSAKREFFAAEILTYMQGPFAGLTYEVKESLKSTTTKKLDERTELRLAKSEHKPEPWILECVRDKSLLWSVVVSNAPAQSIADVKFGKDPPLKLHEWGWSLTLDVNEPKSGQTIDLFIGPSGELECYFFDANDDEHRSTKKY